VYSLILRLGAFEGSLNDNVGILDGNEMRGTPDGLCSHMWVFLQILLSHAKVFGGIGGKDGQLDVVWGSQEVVGKRPRDVLVKNGFYGGDIAQACARVSKEGILDRPVGEYLEISFGCLRVGDKLRNAGFALCSELGALFERRINEDDVYRSSGMEKR
jgi:hypothetical protein